MCFVMVDDLGRRSVGVSGMRKFFVVMKWWLGGGGKLGEVIFIEF